MLAIPQPVLYIHGLDTNKMKLTRLESNTYMALGIKEEPEDMPEYREVPDHFDKINDSNSLNASYSEPSSDDQLCDKERKKKQYLNNNQDEVEINNNNDIIGSNRRRTRAMEKKIQLQNVSNQDLDSETILDKSFESSTWQESPNSTVPENGEMSDKPDEESVSANESDAKNGDAIDDSFSDLSDKEDSSSSEEEEDPDIFRK